MPNFVTGVNRYVGLYCLLESHRSHGELIGSHWNLREEKFSGIVCDGVVFQLRIARDRHDSGVGYRSAGGVFHLAGDFRGIHLAEREGGAQHQYEDSRQKYSRP